MEDGKSSSAAHHWFALDPGLAVLGEDMQAPYVAFQGTSRGSVVGTSADDMNSISKTVPSGVRWASVSCSTLVGSVLQSMTSLTSISVVSPG